MGSYRGFVSYERGTPVGGWGGACSGTAWRRKEAFVEAWPFYRTSSGVRLCWELEEPKGPKGRYICVNRGFPPIRKRSPPRNPLGPWAQAYGRVLGGCVFICEVPLYVHVNKGVKERQIVYGESTTSRLEGAAASGTHVQGYLARKTPGISKRWLRASYWRRS